MAASSVLAGYRIVGKLGAGGMGEGYRATDSTRQREVALKVLAPDFAHGVEWLSRFQREARLLASAQSSAYCRNLQTGRIGSRVMTRTAHAVDDLAAPRLLGHTSCDSRESHDKAQNGFS